MIFNVNCRLSARRLPCPQASTGAFVSTPSAKELARQPYLGTKKDWQSLAITATGVALNSKVITSTSSTNNCCTDSKTSN